MDTGVLETGKTMPEQKILVHTASRSLNLPVSGETLAQTIWLSGKVFPPALCSGLGRCGACRVQFVQGAPDPLAIEYAVLGEVLVQAGWRLACRHPARPGMEVRVPETEGGDELSLLTQTTQQKSDQQRVLSEQTWQAVSAERVLLGVDIGTTSVCWRFVDAAGTTCGEGRMLNPQMGAGSDVVSRIAAGQSAAGRGRLRDLLLQALRSLVDERTVSVCLAGNTAMTALLLNADLSGLAGAPYRIPDAGGRFVELPGLPPAWIPPQPAPFVGGDISAGMVALLATKPRFPFLFADMGTNGEFVLALSEQESLITSVPLGPALEGIGLSCGNVAGTGSVTGFVLGPQGLRPTVLGGGTPTSLCGVGYLSLVDVLLRAGVLQQDGRLAGQAVSPLAQKILALVQRDSGGSWRLPLPGALYLTGADVEELLKVKAAFSVALSMLLAEAKVSPGSLHTVFLGGALGEYASPAVLEHLGFFPAGSAVRMQVAGNTSLAGAVLLAQDAAWRELCMQWASRCRTFDLVSAPGMMEHYIRHIGLG